MHDTFSKCRLQYYHLDQSRIHQETMMDINRYFYNIREWINFESLSMPHSAAYSKFAFYVTLIFKTIEKRCRSADGLHVLTGLIQFHDNL